MLRRVYGPIIGRQQTAERICYTPDDFKRAMSTDSVQTIVIAADMQLSAPLTVTRPFVEIRSAGGAALRANPNGYSLVIDANDVSLSGLIIKTQTRSENLIGINETSGGFTNEIYNLRVTACRFFGCNNVFETPGSSKLERSVWTGNIVGDANISEQGGTIDAALQYCNITGNTCYGQLDITIKAGGIRNMISGNRLGTVDTSASSGSNVIVGNQLAGTLTPHASDFYQTATDNDPLNG